MTENINPWSVDSPEEKEEAKEHGGARIVNIKFPEGKTKIRILGEYKFYKRHWFNKVKREAVCPGKDCPVCAHPDRAKFLDQARHLREVGKEKEAKELFRKTFSTYDPDTRYAVNVLDRTDGTVKVWRFSRKTKEDIMAYAKDYGDPNNYDITVVRTGLKKEDTEYRLVPDRENTPLTEAEKQLKLVPLGVIFKATTADKINAYLRGELPKRAEPRADAVADADPTPVAPAIPADGLDGINLEDLNTEDLGL